MYYPVVSLVAFISGSCLGFYFAGRTHRLW